LGRVGVASGDWSGEGREVLVGVGVSVGEGVAVGVGMSVGEGVAVGVGVSVGEGVAVGVGVSVAEGSGVVSSASWSEPSEPAGCDSGAAWSGGAVPVARNKRIIASPDVTSNLWMASWFIVIPPRARDVLALKARNSLHTLSQIGKRPASLVTRRPFSRRGPWIEVTIVPNWHPMSFICVTASFRVDGMRIGQAGSNGLK
jgi:hypothetical protein